MGYPHQSWKKHQRKPTNTSILSSTILQELHPSLSIDFSFSHIFKLFMTTQPCSIFPSSRFSSPTSPSATPFVPAVTSIFWLIQKMSPGIVPPSILDTKDVLELTHKASIFLGINSSASKWWWQLTAISRTQLLLFSLFLLLPSYYLCNLCLLSKQQKCLQGSDLLLCFTGIHQAPVNINRSWYLESQYAERAVLASMYKQMSTYCSFH